MFQGNADDEVLNQWKTRKVERGEKPLRLLLAWMTEVSGFTTAEENHIYVSKPSYRAI